MIESEEREFIIKAFKFLDKPGFLLRLANTLGKPLEIALGSLPGNHQQIIQRASQKALSKGLMVVTKTVKSPQQNKKRSFSRSFSQSDKKSLTSGRMHSLASFGVGAAGGLFGILSLPIELPFTTAIMLRSIATIAQEFGMDLNDPQVQLECLYILSLGAHGKNEEAMNSAYWTSRVAFSNMSREAAKYLAGKTGKEILREVQTRSAPALVKLLASVATRFEVVVSEKFLAEALPVVGAVGGGAINAAFTGYFSDAARFHFGLRALENRHGREAIETYYKSEASKS